MANLIPIKILILGNSGVGKTSLCNRYVKDNYLEAYRPTIGGEAIFFSNNPFLNKWLVRYFGISILQL